MFKVNNENTRKTPERRHWRLSGVSIVDFKQVNVSCVNITQRRMQNPVKI